jgi:hypothetical protein
MLAHLRQLSNAHKILVRKPGGKRPFGKPVSRLENNKKVDLAEVACDDQGWMELGQDFIQWHT